MSRLAEVSRIKLLIVSVSAVIAMGSVAAIPTSDLLAAHDGTVVAGGTCLDGTVPPAGMVCPDENNWG
jgi:hypothetical protein